MFDQHMADTFVELADTLVAGFDVIDFLHTLSERCVQLLDVDAAGILLVDQRGSLSVVAASNDEARVLELVQLQHLEGPCLECYHSGAPVTCVDLAAQPERWPHFAEAALDVHFTSVQAVPMRLRSQILGAMNLFSASSEIITPRMVGLAQALADVATIGILHERTLHRDEIVAEQLEMTLNNRIVVEQATGVLAATRDLSMEEAFDLLRRQAREQRRGLSTIAYEVVSGLGPPG